MDLYIPVLTCYYYYNSIDKDIVVCYFFHKRDGSVVDDA